MCAEITPASKFSWSKGKKVLTVKRHFLLEEKKKEKEMTPWSAL